ncbi:plasmid pRiA4b ORF-3 family protein [Lewinella sp. 4G2]|uniref:plasmid pRiA4b ORF-3 family protein n=1 Tax=Lewinella sp. 4G2 TaxID=1803372 RepID=UPI0007B4D397|nr:plasmid pRiA4b ORF-3 family protein [Lewinella sp. 4G2]OAV43598.1 hypothetical protein A3850_003395 [Lewinella sp. 4G2]
MLSQSHDLLAVLQRAAMTGAVREDAHFLQATTLYGSYFRALNAGAEPEGEDLHPDADALVDALETALDERIALGLDNGLVPEEFVSQDALSEAAFAEVNAELVEALKAYGSLVDYFGDTDGSKKPAPVAVVEELVEAPPAAPEVTESVPVQQPVVEAVPAVAEPAVASDVEDLLDIRVSLYGSSPPIWRRFSIPAGASVKSLHRIIQTAFEWQGHHLHEFNVGYSRFGPVESDGESYAGMTVGDVLEHPGEKIGYIYDFGDDWRHVIELMGKQPNLSGRTRARCTAGRMAAPLDDCGGLPGFYDYVEILERGPEDPDYDDAARALGKDFNPAEFDLVAVDAGVGEIGLG